MARHPWGYGRRSLAVLLVALGLALPSFGTVRADPKPALKPIPESADDLKALQKQVRVALDKVVPCTVGVRIGGSSGSGVIVSKDGYVLTAGHVSGQPNRDCTLILPDGKSVKGKTLGGNHGIDTGLIKITEEKDWPFVEMGESANLKQGDWVIAAGHPGGFRQGRTPPVRLGRILSLGDRAIQTDCTVVGGDSGGPLFNLEGKVIGIHSRIGGPITANIHVPVDAFRAGWDRMAKAEVWGRGVANTNNAYLGIQVDVDGKGCKVTVVVDKSPAGKAGLKVNDNIAKFDGQAVNSFEELGKALGKKKPGDEVTVEVVRGTETVTLKVTLAKRGG